MQFTQAPGRRQALLGQEWINIVTAVQTRQSKTIDNVIHLRERGYKMQNFGTGQWGKQNHTTILSSESKLSPTQIALQAL